MIHIERVSKISKFFNDLEMSLVITRYVLKLIKRKLYCNFFLLRLIYRGKPEFPLYFIFIKHYRTGFICPKLVDTRKPAELDIGRDDQVM